MSKNKNGSEAPHKKLSQPALKTRRQMQTKLILDSPYLQPIVPTTSGVYFNSTMRNLSKTSAPIYSRPTSVNAMLPQNISQKGKSDGNKSIQPADRKLSVTSSQCKITLRFARATATSSPSASRHNVCIYQQINRGNPVFVYQGWLHFQETFTFTSRPHRGFPFSITIYVNSLLVQRVSVCCEYKQRRGSRLGGAKGLFALVAVCGSFPCYKCQMSERSKQEAKENSTKKAAALADSSESDDERSTSDNYEDDFEDEDSDRGNKKNNLKKVSSSSLSPATTSPPESQNDDGEETNQLTEIILEQLTVGDTDAPTGELANDQDPVSTVVDDGLAGETSQGGRDTEESVAGDDSTQDSDGDKNSENNAAAFEQEASDAEVDDSSETDDDVVYQAGESTRGSASRDPDLETADDRAEPNGWPDYGEGKPFDSSDDDDEAAGDDGNEGGRRSARHVTVTADIHSYSSKASNERSSTAE